MLVETSEYLDGLDAATYLDDAPNGRFQRLELKYSRTVGTPRVEASLLTLEITCSPQPSAGVASGRGTPTVTRSPGTTLMRNRRIRPLNWASTSWPLARATRNMVPGSTCVTEPDSSIGSSFATPFAN